MTLQSTHQSSACRFASVRAVAVLACCVILISGCQPQNRTGGLFGFGNRPVSSSGSSLFGGGGFGGSSFSNPFARNQQVAQAANSGLGQIAGQFGGGQIPSGSAAGSNPFQFNQEHSRLSQRIGAYDADNELLNTEVATLQQKLELANQYNQTLKQQLSDMTGRINRSGSQDRINQQQFVGLQQQVQQLTQRIQEQDSLLAQRQSRLDSLQNRPFQPASSGPGQRGSGSRFDNPGPFQNAGFSGGNVPGGSATIRANNGLMQKLNAIRIPGGDTRMDGDVIRIEFPTDRLFTSGSFRVQPGQLPLLQNVASTIRESFPRQIIGIEAHWDGTPLNPPGTTDHQLTATQSLAVFEELVRLGIPNRQMFTMGMASNRPRHRQGVVGGVSPNRRIELVIYPETWDGR